MHDQTRHVANSNHNKRLTRPLHLMNACQNEDQLVDTSAEEMRTKRGPPGDHAADQAKQQLDRWLGPQRDLHLVYTWSAPLFTTWSLCGMRIQFISMYLTSQVHFMKPVHKNTF